MSGAGYSLGLTDSGVIGTDDDLPTHEFQNTSLGSCASEGQLHTLIGGRGMFKGANKLIRS